MLIFVLVCGLLAVLYGLWTSRSILSLDMGNKKMQEIALAIQEGAKAYLNRQYKTISIVGLIIFFIVWYFFGPEINRNIIKNHTVTLQDRLDCLYLFRFSLLR